MMFYIFTYNGTYSSVGTDRHEEDGFYYPFDRNNYLPENADFPSYSESLFEFINMASYLLVFSHFH